MHCYDADPVMSELPGYILFVIDDALSVTTADIPIFSWNLCNRPRYTFIHSLSVFPAVAMLIHM